MTEEMTKINMKYPPIISDNKHEESVSNNSDNSGGLPLLIGLGIVGFLALKSKSQTRPIVQPTVQQTQSQPILTPEEEMRKFEMMQAGLKKRQKMMEEEKKKQTGFQTEINTTPSLMPLRDRLISPDTRRIKFGFSSDQGIS